MATVSDIIHNLMARGVEVGEEEDAFGPPAPSNGLPPPPWSPHQSVIAAGRTLGLSKGYKPLYSLAGPKGSVIGFPFPNARPNQLEAVEAVEAAFKAGDDVLLDGPTGFGKSPVEIGIVSRFKSAYLLIGRNDLVDQWERDFQDFQDIGFFKARQRFDCNTVQHEGRPANCSQGQIPCSKQRKDAKSAGKDCSQCPYAVNRDLALAAPYTVMTLALGLTAFKYMGNGGHPGVQRREVLVIDECSELESEIMRFYEFSTSTRSLFKAIPSPTSMDGFFPRDDSFYNRWPNVAKAYDAKMARDKIPLNFGEAVACMRPDNILQACVLWALDIGELVRLRQTWVHGEDDEQTKIMKACSAYLNMVRNMMECVKDKIPHFAVIEPGEDPQDYIIRIAPLEARGMLQRLVEPFAEHLIFVSATTGTVEMFKASHAYDRPLVKIEVPSTFPRDNRLIYNMRSGNMSKKTQLTDAPKVMAKLIELAGYNPEGNPKFQHANQKGLVHTYSSDITRQVVDAFRAAGMRNRVIVLQGSGRQREDMMKVFRNSKDPLILVSPSAMLGLSLDNDLGRWQAVVKVPYPFLGDPSIVHRKDNIQGWYEWQVAKDLLQTFGRIVRSDTDWGSTYILDEAFTRFYTGNYHLFPTYVQQAIWQSQ